MTVDTDTSRPDRTSALGAEKAVLGSLLHDPARLEDVGEIISADDFVELRHRTIYRTIASERGGLDVLRLDNRLKQEGLLDAVGGKAYLAELMEEVFGSVEAVKYAHDVREASIRRRLRGIASEMIAAAAASPATSSDLIERFAKSISHLAERRGEDPVRRMADVLQEVVDAIEREQGTPGGLVGLDTGFAALNSLTNGWQRGSLVVVGARPSVGKTTFALTTALHVAKGDKGVYLASAEMSAPEIVRNALCNLGRVSSSLIRSGRMTAIHWRRLVSDGAAAAFNLRFFLDDSPNPTVRQIRSRVRRLAAMPSGLDLVVVDYLQLLRATEGTNREQEVSSLARELKVLAREFNLPVIALSQLNRASTARSDHRPTPADLRESGAIEQHADMIILLHPKDAPASGLAPANVTIQVDLAKNRNGQTGTVDLVRVGPEFRFEDGAAA